MTAFFIAWTVNSLIIAVVFFAGYIGNSYFLLNSPHGAITSWHSRLSRLNADVASSKATICSDAKICTISAPLSVDEKKSIKRFLLHHDSVGKADRRLILIRKRGVFLLASLIVGASCGAVLTLPSLFGMDDVSTKYPLMSLFLGVMSSMLFVGLISWPQAADWTDLINATPDED